MASPPGCTAARSRLERLSSADMNRSVRDAVHLTASLAAVSAVTFVYVTWLHVRNAATVSTTFLLVVLVVAATSRLAIAVATSTAAMLLFNFFFLPPVGTFTIADPQNWIALFAFLAVSLVASNLSAVARARTQEARGPPRRAGAPVRPQPRRAADDREPRGASPALARAVARRFDLEFVAIALPASRRLGPLRGRGADVALDQHRACRARLRRRRQSLEFDAHARTYAGHRTVTVDGGTPSASCRCASAPSRSACSRRPGARSKPGRSTRWPASSRLRSSARTSSRSARRPS